MRSRSWILPLTFSLAALAGACASPLDETLGEATSALRVVTDPELTDLPGCDGFHGQDALGGQVLPTEHEDLYAVSVNGQLLCADDGDGVNAMQRRGIDNATFTPLEGTPLPARTGPTGSDDDGDENPGRLIQGTPLPANH